MKRSRFTDQQIAFALQQDSDREASAHSPLAYGLHRYWPLGTNK
jgi:hypothetical protein